MSDGAATNGSGLGAAQVELISADDLRWQQVLSRVPHDFYHLPEYVSFSAPLDGGEARALWVEDGEGHTLLLPLIIRPVSGGRSDATSPYGYAGPLVQGPPWFRRAALSEGYRHLRAAGVVSVFVRLHPLLDADAANLPGTSVLHGETVAVDLTRPESQQWRETRKSHRQQIRRAQRLGYRVRVDDELRHLDAFSRLYRATMDRRHAESYYRFDDAYFQGLADALRKRMILCVVESGDELCAAGIFVETEGIVESHLSADDPARSRGGVKKLMYDHVRRWAMARGDRWLHLGGGVGGQADSLLDFKAGFSPLRRPFRSLRAITRAADYRRLVREAGVRPEAQDPSAFFPAYRRP